MPDYTLGPVTLKIERIIVRLGLGIGITQPPSASDSAARFAAALANPTPRTIAGVDPVTVTSTKPSGGTIVGGVTHDYTGGKIRLLHGKERVLFGNVYQIDQLHPQQTGGATGVLNGAIEVVYTGRHIELVLNGTGGNAHLFIDGVLTSATGYNNFAGAGGEYGVLTFDLGTAATRRLRFELSNGNYTFGPVIIEPAYALLDPTPVRRCNMIITGDSFTEPAFPSHELNGYPQLLAELLGVDNMIPQGSGGTGYVAEASKADLAQRIVRDLELVPGDDPQADAILFTMGGNDDQASVDGGSFAANVVFCFAAAKSRWPGAVVMATGPLTRPTTPLSYAKCDIIEAACAAHGVRFLPGAMEWMTEYPGDLDDLFHVDGHPNDLGHAWYAAKIDEAIRA